MLEALKNLDAFPKPIDDFRVKTTSGAIISIVSVFLMLCLFYSEIAFYTQVEIVDHLHVSSFYREKLQVSFDVSFPQIPCKLLSVDIVDDLGLPQRDAAHNIFKHKLSTLGEKEGLPQRHDIGDTIISEAQLTADFEKTHSNKKKSEPPSSSGCGNCYGAGLPGQCCESCDDVKKSYARVGWRFKPHEVLQCQKEAFLDTLQDQYAEEGGCQIYGSLELSRLNGHFHIAPHKSLQHGSAGASGVISLIDLLQFTFDQFNISHTVNSLSFGDNFPGIKSPLDGQTRSVVDTHGMYQYYVKIVPTEYVYSNGKTIESNQYAVTEHLRHLSPGSGRGVPGVYFYYSVSPVHATFEEKKASAFKFLTSAFAVVGGAFTVMGLVDIVVTSLLQVFGKSLL